jgi:hypothetical protein
VQPNSGYHAPGEFDIDQISLAGSPAHALAQIACVMEHCCISVWRFVFRQSLSFQLRLLRKQMVDNHADCDASNWH